MKQIYYTEVTELGEMVMEFLEEKMIILFKQGAPAELEEFCVSHEINQLKEDIQPNDTLKVNDQAFQITGVGSAVNKNLASLGHITLKFDGSQEPELPGTLSLEDVDVPEISQGDVLEIMR
ncbi:PTS glucitol/sorbitol transporter subunit IIA [Halobacillus sp. GSS1]|uniref:PTS glucitol/sorbitol transporter subunit IIA n=1 Tax=Halobacillus sp. GSS1 TaxID=2815919 RepID=UPI001A8F3527|nr:PTS glucitol/sorbitol transporter subunit IIA [Halobacillus sp. GSS1]MBN9653395.1 PTS glucitol/sorbitol transporter subunit IIA [Halobacillus sp. GSS1]